MKNTYLGSNFKYEFDEAEPSISNHRNEKYKIFLLLMTKPRKAKNITTPHCPQYEHCIFCTRSLRIPLYNATRFSGIPLILRSSLLQPISTSLRFMCSFLYSSPFPLGSFAFSANCTFFFFFLSLLFSSTVTKRKHSHLQTKMIGCVRELHNSSIPDRNKKKDN